MWAHNLWWQVVASLGVPCLPPIDVTLSPSVPVAFDVVDARKWDFFMQLVTLAAIAFAHFGTPCNTLSAARKDDGGSSPLAVGGSTLGTSWTFSRQ